MQLAAPLPKTSSPLSAFGLKLAKPMASVSNQNCYKGFHFKEKVEKHYSNAVK